MIERLFHPNAYGFKSKLGELTVSKDSGRVSQHTPDGECFHAVPSKEAREFAQAILMACDKADELNGEKK